MSTAQRVSIIEVESVWQQHINICYKSKVATRSTIVLQPIVGRFFHRVDIAHDEKVSTRKISLLFYTIIIAFHYYHAFFFSPFWDNKPFLFHPFGKYHSCGGENENRTELRSSAPVKTEWFWTWRCCFYTTARGILHSGYLQCLMSHDDHIRPCRQIRSWWGVSWKSEAIKTPGFIYLG